MLDAWSSWEPNAETVRQLREMGPSTPKRGAVPNFWTDRRYIPADAEDQAELIGELRQATMEAIRSEAKAQDDLAALQEQYDAACVAHATALDAAQQSSLGALTTVLVVFTIALLFNLAWAISQIGGGR